MIAPGVQTPGTSRDSSLKTASAEKPGVPMLALECAYAVRPGRGDFADVIKVGRPSWPIGWDRLTAGHLDSRELALTVVRDVAKGKLGKWKHEKFAKWRCWLRAGGFCARTGRPPKLGVA